MELLDKLDSKYSLPTIWWFTNFMVGLAHPDKVGTSSYPVYLAIDRPPVQKGIQFESHRIFKTNLEHQKLNDKIGVRCR